MCRYSEYIVKHLRHCDFPPSNALCIYHCVSEPQIEIGEYVEQLIDKGTIMKDDLKDMILIYSLVLLNRCCQTEGFHVCKFSVHRVMLTLLLLSSKLCDDEAFYNVDWASFGGVSNKHLNDLERNSALLLHYRLHVTKRELDSMQNELFPEKHSLFVTESKR